MPSPTTRFVKPGLQGVGERRGEGKMEGNQGGRERERGGEGKVKGSQAGRERERERLRERGRDT